MQLRDIIGSIGAVMAFLYLYRYVYGVIGAFFTRKFAPTDARFRYGILIAARNEEKVISHLIDSIRAQDYDGEVKIFVVADNCTDNTADAAARRGAVVYTRFDPVHRTKGYALQYLIQCIHREFGKEAVDAYIVFDADNLLAPDYLSRMNEAYAAGEKIVTSYRNTKNFDDNCISASYGLHWLRTIRTEHRARSLFRMATRIQGTGFLFDRALVDGGWNYTSLTEDRAFCADAVAAGYRISYCDAAVFYDEQPTDLKTAITQRLRWSKGHLQAFAETGPALLWETFRRPFTRHSFMSYDMLTVVTPRSLISLFCRLTAYVIDLVLMWQLSGKKAVLTLAYTLLYRFVKSWLSKVLSAAYILFVERRRLPAMPLWKKIWFCMTFFIFDTIGKYTTLAALFMQVDWKPIAHTAAVSIEEIKRGSQV